MSCKTDRYSRQLPLIGLEGQQKLKQANVLCIGAGGLGCPALLYLAIAGVGKLGIVDGDRVDVSNLQRQTLFTEKDVGRSKAQCAKERLLLHQSETEIEAYSVFLDAENGLTIIRDYDLVLDGTDNYASRYLVNQLCRNLGKPLVSASVLQFDAQIAVFNLNLGPCYQCLYPTPPPEALIPNCAQAGVFGALTGVMGSLQAAEALKVLLGLKGVLSGQFLRCNLLSMTFQLYPFTHRKGCPTCEKKPVLRSASLEEGDLQIEPERLREWMRDKKEVLLIDVREPYEREIYHIGGTLFPIYQLLQTIPSWPKEATIICYCQSGGRSLRAVHWLRHNGYRAAYSLKGGVVSWV